MRRSGMLCQTFPPNRIWTLKRSTRRSRMLFRLSSRITLGRLKKISAAVKDAVWLSFRIAFGGVYLDWSPRHFQIRSPRRGRLPRHFQSGMPRQDRLPSPFWNELGKGVSLSPSRILLNGVKATSSSAIFCLCAMKFRVRGCDRAQRYGGWKWFSERVPPIIGSWALFRET